MVIMNIKNRKNVILFDILFADKEICYIFV